MTYVYIAPMRRVTDRRRPMGGAVEKTNGRCYGRLLIGEDH